MKSNILKYILLALCLQINVSGVSAKPINLDLYGSGWEHVTTKDDIKIYQKEMKGIQVKSLKAIGLINSKIENIVSILRDVPNSTKWLPRLEERSYVENISDVEAILYDVNVMPWPVKNRDLVVHHHLMLSDDKKSLLLRFKSVNSAKKKQHKDRVRAYFRVGEIKFTPKGNMTRMELTLLVDPMGVIPKWVVNILQVSMPYDFMTALNKFASKTSLVPLPGIQSLIDKLKR